MKRAGFFFALERFFMGAFGRLFFIFGIRAGFFGILQILIRDLHLILGDSLLSLGIEQGLGLEARGLAGIAGFILFAFGGQAISGNSAGGGDVPILFYSRRIGLDRGAANRLVEVPISAQASSAAAWSVSSACTSSWYTVSPWPRLPCS